MSDDVRTQNNKTVSKQQIRLEALSLDEVGQEFRLAFQMHPDLQLGRENLIARILAKVRAELERHS